MTRYLFESDIRQYWTNIGKEGILSCEETVN